MNNILWGNRLSGKFITEAQSPHAVPQSSAVHAIEQTDPHSGHERHLFRSPQPNEPVESVLGRGPMSFDILRTGCRCSRCSDEAPGRIHVSLWRKKLEIWTLAYLLMHDAQAGRTISISFVGTTAQRDIESVAGDRMMGGGEGHQSDRANLDRLNGDPMTTAIKSVEA